MSDTTLEETLAHFGVKGMKWGVHRAPTSRMSAPSKTTRPSTRVATIKKHAVTAGLVASYIAVVLASEAATRGVGNISKSPQTEQGRQFAISNPKIMKAKKSRGGVFKITTL